MKLLNILFGLGICALSLNMTSCSKEASDMEAAASGQVSVGINKLSLGFDFEEESKSQSGANAGSANSRLVQSIDIAGDERTFAATADLIEVKDSPNTGLKMNASKAATPQIAPVPLGTLYRLFVYNADNSFVAYKDFKRGDTGATYGENRVFNLDGGKEYIFVCYTIMSTSALPELPDNPSAPLNLTQINPVKPIVSSQGIYSEPSGNTDRGIDGGSDFCYWISRAKLTDHLKLNINLKHMYVGLQVNIKAPTGGKLWLKNPASGVTNRIDSISRSLPFTNRTTTWLKDGSQTNPYTLGENLQGKTLNFTDQSDVATLVIPAVVFNMGVNETTNGKVVIHNVVLARSPAQRAKRSVSLTGLSFKARTKYILNINIK